MAAFERARHIKIGGASFFIERSIYEPQHLQSYALADDDVLIASVMASPTKAMSASK